MRIAAVVGCCAVLTLGACGGSKKAVVPNGSSTTGGAPATVSTSSAPSTTSAKTTTTTVELPTAPLPCQPLPVPTTPVTSPTASHAALLTNVVEFGDQCVDHVVFDFTGKGTDPPGYSLTYGTPPFVGDASGAPVAVAGNAFVVVKVKPGFGYDFETGRQTYNGPPSIPVAHTNHVRSIVETGDYEGVLSSPG